ncbi:MAG TPA: rubrerythrin family protein [Bacillota bacterium]|nr:rubrerythrin family protein [Bacillota bacterium]HOL09175.1 rubrerythrin family protein [Bacillota bacterium]HPO96850.1 rubrerythrin family protein [Bacillota bacterium]
MSVQNAMTADFLRSAYGGESMAYMRYQTWGNLAAKDGFPNIGRLFQGIAYAEQVHAANHFRELNIQKGDYTVAAGAVFGIGSIVDNLQGAINGELHEVEQMYPVYLHSAQFQNEKGAERSFHLALEAEKIHATLFKKAQQAAQQGEDLELKSVNVCPVCGHTVLDNIPDKCPICGTKKEMYKNF